MTTATATVAPSAVDSLSETLYARMGILLGLKTVLRSEVDLIERLEKGLAVTAVESLRTRVGLTDAETFELIAPRRTLNRRELSGQPLSREEADRTVRIARVTARAQKAFAGKPEYAADWLRTPKRALGDRTPMHVLVTESGALAVEELLLGIEHGVFG